MNRRTLVISLAAVMPGFARAQPMRAAPPVVSTGDAASLVMNPDFPLPAVQVTIGNSRPLWFGIDTGAAGHGRINPDTAAELGLQVIGEVRAGDPSGKNPQTRRLFEAPTLMVGGITFTAPDLAELTLMPQVGPKMDGILGLDLFPGFVVSFDRVKGEVDIVRGELPAADNVAIFQSPPGRILRVAVTIGTQTVAADIDTGHMKDPLMVPDTAGLPVKGKARKVGTARTASQTFDIQAVDLNAPVKLGDITLPITNVTFPSPLPTANLGWEAFRGHVLSIDALNRRVCIT